MRAMRGKGGDLLSEFDNNNGGNVGDDYNSTSLEKS